MKAVAVSVVAVGIVGVLFRVEELRKCA